MSWFGDNFPFACAVVDLQQVVHTSLCLEI